MISALLISSAVAYKVNQGQDPLGLFLNDKLVTFNDSNNGSVRQVPGDLKFSNGGNFNGLNRGRYASTDKSSDDGCDCEDSDGDSDGDSCDGGDHGGNGGGNGGSCSGGGGPRNTNQNDIDMYQD